MFIFWDNSNIHISGLEVMKIREPEQPHELFRTNFNNLFDLVRNNRKVDAAYLSGSIPPPSNQLWDHIKSLGINVQLLNRTADGLEQESVDMSLQTMMLRTAVDYISAPSTIAVLTGDGAGKQLGEGFLSDLKRIKSLGWEIEVYSWENSCNRYLKSYAEENGKFVALDDYYDSITFLKEDRYNPTGAQVRPSTPLKL
ncbi:MAG: NYN domain-containing protein [Candidatus Fimenecus sp.]